MFSVTTTELSTSIPTVRVRALRVTIFSVIFARFIKQKVAKNAVGMEIAITKVELMLLRNRKMTRAARTAPATALCATLEIEFLM